MLMPSTVHKARCGNCEVADKGVCAGGGNPDCLALAFLESPAMAKEVDGLLHTADEKGRLLFAFLHLHQESLVGQAAPFG